MKKYWILERGESYFFLTDELRDKCVCERESGEIKKEMILGAHRKETPKIKQIIWWGNAFAFPFAEGLYANVCETAKDGDSEVTTR